MCVFAWMCVQEVPVLLRLLSLHCLCVPLVLILDECQYAGDRDWMLVQSVSNALVDQVRASGCSTSWSPHLPPPSPASKSVCV